MAINASAQTLYESTLWRYVYFDPGGTLSVVRDVSSRIPYGKNLSIPNANTSITLSTLADNSVGAVTEQQLNDGAQVLNLSNQKSWGIDVADTSVQAYAEGGGFVAEGIRQAALAVRNDLDDMIVTAHAGASDGTLTFDDISVLIDGSTTTPSATKFKFDSANFRKALVDKILDQAIIATERGWGPDRYVIVHPRILGALLKYFVIDTPNFGAGGVVDQAWIDANLTPRLGGFRPVSSVNIAGDSSGTAAKSDQYRMQFGETGMTCLFALQRNMTEVLRSQKFIGDYIRGYYTAGAKVVENNRRLGVGIDFTAS